jgi:DNA modification methylase
VIHHGDCVEVMAGMEPESVDAIVTDPPYGLEFMGKAWDRLFDKRPSGGFRGGVHVGRQGPTYRAGTVAQEWHEVWAREALRVAKPGAYLLAFGGTRTVHRLACAIEDAGWIIRDTLVWAYAQGFPKSKASLKPAWEPIVMARKPGPLRELAIDACRIPLVEGDAEFMASRMPAWNRKAEWDGPAAINVGERSETPPIGRWPANVILTDPIFDGGIEGVVGGGEAAGAGASLRTLVDNAQRDSGFHMGTSTRDIGGDTGTYSRFFLIPKADRTDREPVLSSLTPGFAPTMGNGIGGREHDPANIRAYRENTHPTVKPTELMRHLIRLVTPFGGVVLDPFAGSGSTLIAAETEGFAWVGIEKDESYIAIAEARLNGTQRGLGLSA